MEIRKPNKNLFSAHPISVKTEEKGQIKSIIQAITVSKDLQVASQPPTGKTLRESFREPRLGTILLASEQSGRDLLVDKRDAQQGNTESKGGQNSRERLELAQIDQKYLQ